MELLATLLGDVAAETGVDGRRLLDGLGRGETLADMLSLPPRFTDVLYGRAHTWFTAGRFERAESLFRALCVVDGRVADHWVGYGVCLSKRNLRAEAALAFATAAALRPEWAVPHFHAADLAVAEGNWTAAEDHLSAFAQRTDPRPPDQMLAEADRLRRSLSLRAALRDRTRNA